MALYDDYLAEQAYSSRGSYSPSYSYEPSYQEYDYERPTYSYDQPSYDYSDYGQQYGGYEQPSYQQQYQAPTPDLSYQAPAPSYQTQQPEYSAPDYVRDANTQASRQKAQYEANQYAAGNAYSTSQSYAGGNDPNPLAWSPYLAQQAGNAPSPTPLYSAPGRAANQPAPYVAPAYDPAVASNNTYEAQQYAAGNVYSTGEQQGGLWNAYRTNDPAAEMRAVQEQRAAQIASAEETSANLDRLRDQEQLATARFRAGQGPPTEEGMGATFVPEATGPLDWVGDRSSNLGTFVNRLQQSKPAELTGNVLGGVGDTLYEGFDRLRENAQRPGAESAVTQAGMANPAGFINEDTPFLGGFGRAFNEMGTTASNAENLGEVLMSPLAALNVPDDWRQVREGEMAYDLAAGNGRSTYLDLPGPDTSDIPVIGQALQMPSQWAYEASPAEKEVIVRVFEDAEAATPGSGGRAVWEFYQSGRNTLQRGIADAAGSPWGAVPGGRAATGFTAGLGRAAQMSPNRLVRFGGKLTETGSNVLGASLGAADAAADLGVTPLATQVSRRFMDTPLGAPFRRTPAAQLQNQLDSAGNQTGDLLSSYRGAGSPGPPVDTTPIISPSGGNPNGSLPTNGFSPNGNGIDPRRFTRANTSTQRRGAWNIHQNNDGEAIVTGMDNREVITPYPLTLEQAESVIENLRAGSTPVEAAAVGERLRTGWDAPPSEPIPAPPDVGPRQTTRPVTDQPNPETRMTERIDDIGGSDPNGDVVLVSDNSGRYWLENPDTGADLYGSFDTYAEAHDQLGNASNQVRLDRASRTTTPTEVTGGIPGYVPNPPIIPAVDTSGFGYGRRPGSTTGDRYDAMGRGNTEDAWYDRNVEQARRTTTQPTVTGGLPPAPVATSPGTMPPPPTHLRRPPVTLRPGQRPIADEIIIDRPGPELVGDFDDIGFADITVSDEGIEALRQNKARFAPDDLPPEAEVHRLGANERLVVTPGRPGNRVVQGQTLDTSDPNNLTWVETSRREVPDRDVPDLIEQLNEAPIQGHDPGLYGFTDEDIGWGNSYVDTSGRVVERRALGPGSTPSSPLREDANEIARLRTAAETNQPVNLPAAPVATSPGTLPPPPIDPRVANFEANRVLPEQTRWDTNVLPGRQEVTPDIGPSGNARTGIAVGDGAFRAVRKEGVDLWDVHARDGTLIHEDMTQKQAIRLAQDLTDNPSMALPQSAQVATSPGTLPDPPAATDAPAFTTVTRGKRTRIVVDQGNGITRPPTADELEPAYQQMRDMPEDEFLATNASTLRGEMYNQRFLRKSPTSQPDPQVRQQPDGTYRIVDGRTDNPLDSRTYKVDKSYSTERAANARVAGIRTQAATETAGYERYVDLMAYRMTNSANPVAFAQSLRNPEGGSAPVKPAVIAEIKARAGVADSGLPPAPDGEAISLTGERIAADPTANPANRLGVVAATNPAEYATSGFARGQTLRDAMARPGNVQATLGRAPAPDAKYRELNVTPDNVALMQTPMPRTHGPDKDYGDAFFDTVDEVAEAVDLANNRATLAPAQTKRLEALAKKYGVTDYDELATLDEVAQDRIIQDRLIADLRTERIADGQDPTQAANAVSAFYTGTKGYFRSLALYNITTVPRQFIMNVVGNPIASLLFKPSIWMGRGGMMDVKNWDRGMRQAFNEARGGKVHETTYVHLSKSLGHVPRADVTSGSAIDDKSQMGTASGLWGRGSKHKAVRALSKATLTETGYLFVKGADDMHRQITAFAPAREQLPQMVREIRTHAKDAAQRMGVLVSEEQIDVAIDGLVTRAIQDPGNAGLPAFSAADLKAALGGLQTNAGPSPANWADRVHRDWRQATDTLMGDMSASSNKWAGNFSQTNLDEALGNVAKFHVWASRMSALYVTETLRNPHILTAYVNAIDGLHKMAEDENYPDSVKGFFDIFRSIGGYAGFIDPRFFIPGFLVGAENVYQEDGAYGLTKVGEGMQWLQEHGFPIIETFRAFTYYSGMEGGGNLAPDPTYGIRDSLGVIPQLINASGVLGKIGLDMFEEAGVIGAPVRQITSNTAHAISGWFVNGPLQLEDIGFKQVPLQSEEYLRGDYEIGQIVSDIVARDNEGISPEEHEKLVTDAMAEKDGAVYQEAYVQWSGGLDLAKAANRLLNPFPMQFRNEANDQRGLAIRGYEGGTQDEADAAKIVNRGVRAASPEDAALQQAQDAYFDAYDNLGNAAASTYFNIIHGEVRQTFRVNGQDYFPEQVAAMSESDRYQLAERWMEGISQTTGEDVRTRMETRYDAQNAILEANPNLAGSVEFNKRAEEYGPGVDAFIAETARINPNYAGYLSGLPYPAGTEEYQKAATGFYAAQIAQGIATDIFNPMQQESGRGRVAGLPEETTLAEAQTIRQAEREATQAAAEERRAEGQEGWTSYIADTSTALMYFNERLTEREQVLRDAGVSDADIELYFSRVADEWEGRLPNHIYTPLRDAFGSDKVYAYPEDADGTGNGGAYDYWVARRHDPTLELEDFLSTRSAANRAEREAFTAETGLAGTPSFTGTLPETESTAADPTSLGVPHPELMPGGSAYQPYQEMTPPTGSRQAERAAMGLGDLDPSSPALADGPPIVAGGLVGSILGGTPTNTDYGFRAPTSLPFYGYFEGHGGTPNEHTGIDATGVRGQEMRTPMGGTVTCGGTGFGGGSWGTGCAEFGDDQGGAGRLEIMLDDGSSLILGHAAMASVLPGQRVEPGQVVGLMGTGNAVDHVHVERRVWDEQLGTYIIIDPDW